MAPRSKLVPRRSVRNGQIVFVSSSGVQRPQPGSSQYTAIKGGLAAASDPFYGRWVVKVMKSTGAVAVYSPVRVVAIIVGAVLVIAGIGFGIGRIGHGGDSSSASSAPAAQASDGKTYANGYRQGQAAGRRQAAAAIRTDGGATSSTATKAAYTRGFAAGKASVKRTGASAAPLPPGSFFVKVERGAGGRTVIGPHIELQAGRIYSLCRGGKTVCVRSGTLAPGTPGTKG